MYAPVNTLVVTRTVIVCFDGKTEAQLATMHIRSTVKLTMLVVFQHEITYAGVLYVQTMAKLVDLIDNSTISCGNKTTAK